jgi:hypothetical protein
MCLGNTYLRPKLSGAAERVFQKALDRACPRAISLF